MRLKATDEKAANVAAVLVDGKKVSLPIEVDTDEGWVICARPLVRKDVLNIDNPNPDTDNPEEAGDAQWVEFRIEGKVEIIFNEEK